jgi:ParB family chromosome partitioning protein
MSTKRETAIDFLGGLDDPASNPPQYVAITSLMPDSNQPRKEFDHEALQRLAAGIKSDGVLQPLLVRDSGTNPPYIITDGERRWRAAQLIKLNELPILIRNDIDQNRLRFAQAMANANRENLTDYELAIVIQEQLDNNPKLKKKDVAEQLGKDAATISRLLALLDPTYSELAKNGLIENASTLSHFKALDDDSKAKLLEDAQNGKTITRDLIEQRKAEIAALTTSAILENTAQDKNLASSKINDAMDDENHEQIIVAMPQEKSEGLTTKVSVVPTVRLSLKVEDIELLIPFFVDKEAEKLDVKMSIDTAIGLIEKLGQTVPIEITNYAQTIKDGIKNFLEK